MTKNSIGKNVRMIRRMRNMTQATLAWHIGVDAAFICRIEKGRRKVDENLVRRFAEIFDVRPELLIEGFESEKLPDAPAEQVLRRLAQAVLSNDNETATKIALRVIAKE